MSQAPHITRLMVDKWCPVMFFMPSITNTTQAGRHRSSLSFQLCLRYQPLGNYSATKFLIVIQAVAVINQHFH